MVKMIALVKKRDGLTIEEFSRYWFDKHAPLVGKLLPQSVSSGWEKYIQNYAISLNNKGKAPFDGVAELYFNDMSSFWLWSNWYFSDEGKSLREDEDNFMDRTKTIVILAEEKIVF